MKEFLNMYLGPVRMATLATVVLVLMCAVGVFLPWYGDVSLFGVITAGFGMSGSMSELAAKFDFAAMSTWFNAIFVIIAAMALFSMLFGARMIVSSLSGRVKGLVPAGVLMSVLALAGFAITLLLGGLGSVQIGLWLCLLAGLTEALWGIFE